MKSIEGTKEISEINVWSVSKNEHLPDISNYIMLTRNKYDECLTL